MTRASASMAHVSLQVCIVFDMPIEGVFQRQHLECGKTLLKGKKMDVTYAGETKPVRVTTRGTGIVQGHCCNLQRVAAVLSGCANPKGEDTGGACRDKSQIAMCGFLRR